MRTERRQAPMKRIAYIPARSGSKGIPKKNIRPLCGKPLLGYAVETALETGLFSRVFVSTDSDEIAEVARAYGAWVPFLRNAALAGDTTLIMDAILDDVRRLAEINERFDTFCLLQPTSPLRTADAVRRAVELCEARNEGVVSVSPVSEHPILMRTMSPDGRLARLLAMPSSARRQDMPMYYRVNGAVYCIPCSQLVEGTVLADSPLGIVMPEDASVDIDDMEDIRRAEEIIKRMRG